MDKFNPSEPPKPFRDVVLPMGVWEGAKQAAA
jgi:hypothetical protein